MTTRARDALPLLRITDHCDSTCRIWARYTSGHLQQRLFKQSIPKSLYARFSQESLNDFLTDYRLAAASGASGKWIFTSFDEELHASMAKAM
jgi:hypothetical protein